MGASASRVKGLARRATRAGSLPARAQPPIFSSSSARSALETATTLPRTSALATWRAAGLGSQQSAPWRLHYAIGLGSPSRAYQSVRASGIQRAATPGLIA